MERLFKLELRRLREVFLSYTRIVLGGMLLFSILGFLYAGLRSRNETFVITLGFILGAIIVMLMSAPFFSV